MKSAGGGLESMECLLHHVVYGARLETSVIFRQSVVAFLHNTNSAKASRHQLKEAIGFGKSDRFGNSMEHNIVHAFRGRLFSLHGEDSKYNQLYPRKFQSCNPCMLYVGCVV
ncbi:hypothetical protein P8452_14589 [Trifolium repens]|nr:hypothetical protein P8452_14589 [Trifolium repens]